MTRKVPPKKRAYRSELRAAGADETRRAILDAARTLLVEKGYGAMRMERIARDAGVALDTVYASVGSKPLLVRLLVETAISGGDAAVPAEEREYVKRIRAAPSAKLKLGMYAEALRSIHTRLAPLVRALRDAAAEHPDLAALWREISDRRHRNMLLFADDLLATGGLRADVAREEVADTLWTIGAPELFLLLTQERGWSGERFSAWLATRWYRLLLREPEIDSAPLRLSAQRALLGAVSREVDAIGLHVDGTRIVVQVASGSALDDDAREALEVAASEIIADFPNATFIAVDHVASREAFLAPTTLVFHRLGAK